MSGSETKNTILDAAETLFAEQGYAATSLRQLTTRAGKNLAAVNYHFGGKEALAKAVLERRIQPINTERLRRLDAIPARQRSVAAIVRAFVEPPLRGGTTGRGDDTPGTRLCRVFGRVSVEQPPFLRSFLAQQFRTVGRRFESALAEALPGHDAATLWWRLHFVVGAMAHTLQNSAALAHLTKDLCRADDVDALVEHLVAFAIGGLRAAPARPARRKTARKVHA
jgi:AcrR family transcriptional regulator